MRCYPFLILTGRWYATLFLSDPTILYDIPSYFGTSLFSTLCFLQMYTRIHTTHPLIPQIINPQSSFSPSGRARQGDTQPPLRRVPVGLAVSAITQYPRGTRIADACSSYKVPVFWREGPGVVSGSCPRKGPPARYMNMKEYPLGIRSSLVFLCRDPFVLRQPIMALCSPLQYRLRQCSQPIQIVQLQPLQHHALHTGLLPFEQLLLHSPPPLQ